MLQNNIAETQKLYELRHRHFNDPLALTMELFLLYKIVGY